MPFLLQLARTAPGVLLDEGLEPRDEGREQRLGGGVVVPGQRLGTKLKDLESTVSSLEKLARPQRQSL